MAPRLIHRMSEVIARHGKGAFEDACNDGLKEIIEALAAQPTDKGKGKLTLEFDIAYQNGMVQIAPALKIKLPAATTHGTEIYWTVDGALTTQHPQQVDLEDSIRDVKAREQTA